LLLLVPLALARPAFSPAWVAPLVLWVDAAGSSGGSATRIAALLGLAAVGLAWSILAYREESPRSAAFAASLPGSRPMFAIRKPPTQPHRSRERIRDVEGGREAPFGYRGAEIRTRDLRSPRPTR
jgi:hypothetical protein